MAQWNQNSAGGSMPPSFDATNPPYNANGNNLFAPHRSMMETQGSQNNSSDETRQLLEKLEEENFGLHASLAVAEVEHREKVQEIEQKSEQELRSLRDQLRRLQQEANLERKRSEQLQTKLNQRESATDVFQHRMMTRNPSSSNSAAVANILPPQRPPSREKPRETVQRGPTPPPSRETPADRSSRNSGIKFHGSHLANYLLEHCHSSQDNNAVVTYLSQMATTEFVDTCHMIQKLMDHFIFLARKEDESSQASTTTTLQWIYRVLLTCSTDQMTELSFGELSVDSMMMDGDDDTSKNVRRSSLRRKEGTPLSEATANQIRKAHQDLRYSASSNKTSTREIADTDRDFQILLCRHCINVPQRTLLVVHSVWGLKVVQSLLSQKPWDIFWKELVMNSDNSLVTLWNDAVAFLCSRKHTKARSTRRLFDPMSDMHRKDELSNRSVDTNDKKEQNEQDNVWKAVDLVSLCEWMTVCLDTLTCLWSATIRNAGRVDVKKMWFDSNSRHVRCILASVLDLLEICIIPDPAAYRNDLTRSCVSFLQALLVDFSGRQTLLLQMATSQSTDEYWHRASSAVGVVVHFFYQIVLHQHKEDHLPATTPENRSFNPIRDELVHFLNGLNSVVRREQGGNHSTSFYSVVQADHPEFLRSAIIMLLDDAESSACSVDKDVKELLKGFLEEIELDEQEMAIEVDEE